MSANQQLPFIMARCNHRPLPFAGKGVWGVAAVAVIAGVLSLPGWSWMSLDATSLARGEWWTLWTGHFRHWTFAHFFWDWTLFVVCLWILRNEGKALWGGVIVALPILSLGVFLLRPDLFEYRGLSGIDTVLFARIASGILVSCLRQQTYGALFWLGAVAPLVGLGAKIGWELQTGGALFSGDLGPGNVVVSEVHGMGFLLGVLWTLGGVRNLWPI